MIDKPPRCQHCKQDNEEMLERVSKPIKASMGASMWLCFVCSKTFEWPLPVGAQR